MSAKELKIYSDSNNLILNNLITKSSTIETLTTDNVDCNALTAVTGNIQTLTSSGVSSLAYVTSTQHQFVNLTPDIIHNKVATVYSANASELLNMTVINNGIIVNNYIVGTLTLNFPTAASMYAAYPLINGQCISLLICNPSLNAVHLDTADTVHVKFNGSTYIPVIAAGTNRYTLVMFTGTPSVPTYSIFV